MFIIFFFIVCYRFVRYTLFPAFLESRNSFKSLWSAYREEQSMTFSPKSALSLSNVLRPASSLSAFYPAINAQHFQCFLHVGNGIKDKPIRSDDAHLHSGEVIHKALEDGTYVRAVTFQGNILRRDTAFEKAITQFHSSCLVTKADGIVPFAMHTVSNLLAVGNGNIGINASFFQVAQQSGFLQRSHPNVLEDGFFLFIPLWTF